MLRLNREFVDERLHAVKGHRRRLLEEENGTDEDRSKRLRELLEALVEVVEHLRSRSEDSFATTYRDRARGLVEMGLLEERYVEQVLVPLATLYESRVGLHMPLKDKEIRETIRDHLPRLDRFVEAVEDLLEHPDQYGLEEG